MLCRKLCVGLVVERGGASSGRVLAGAAARARERQPGVEARALQPRGACGAQPEGGDRLLQEHAARARQRASRMLRSFLLSSLLTSYLVRAPVSVKALVHSIRLKYRTVDCIVLVQYKYTRLALRHSLLSFDATGPAESRRHHRLCRLWQHKN